MSIAQKGRILTFCTVIFYARHDGFDKIAAVPLRGCLSPILKLVPY
jgi:hypothetical protein